MTLSTNQSILRGTFTSDGASQTVTLPWLPHRFELINTTMFGSVNVTTPVITAEWRQGMVQNSVLTGRKTSNAATLDLFEMNVTEGVVTIDTSIQTPEAPQLGTSVSTAAAAVVTMVGPHGYLIGDRVRLTNTTSMLQIGGMEFTITDVPSPTTFTLATLNTSSFTAPATAVTVRRIPAPIYNPRYLWLTSMVQGSTTAVQVSTTGPSFLEPGQVVTIKVPDAFGMVEADGLSAEVISIIDTLGIAVLDLDSSSFTNFTFPPSAEAAAGVDFPLLVPFGNELLSPGVNVLDNQSTFEVRLGTNAIGEVDQVMEWIATRSLTF